MFLGVTGFCVFLGFPSAILGWFLVRFGFCGFQLGGIGGIWCGFADFRMLWDLLSGLTFAFCWFWVILGVMLDYSFWMLGLLAFLVLGGFG